MSDVGAIVPLSKWASWCVRGDVDGYRGQWFDRTVSGNCCDTPHGSAREAADCLARVMVESVSYPWEHPKPGTWADTVRYSITGNDA